MTASGKVRKVDMRKTAVSMLGLTDIAAPQYAYRPLPGGRRTVAGRA
jgi:hypothetical protein